MKVAIVYNRDSQNVINLFGMPNREKIGLKTIKRLSDSLKKGKHQVIAIEADKDLVDKLEEFMPRVIKGERPGMVFNVSYGIQGQARYTHVPSILEMMGVPYVASGPLAHSLALDKVITKMILRHHNLPTPDFAVLDRADAPIPDLKFPLIVKPKNEAVSFGIKIVHDPEGLREAAQIIIDEFRQPVLVEQYIDGREVNVGLIGNDPPEALPPVELLFGTEGPAIYTLEDKRGTSGRKVDHACPAPIGEKLLAEAKEISIKAFEALGCCDCARVDLRLDKEGRLYILEINSLPSLGEHGSYLIGAAHIGLHFSDVINRLVDEASVRYFGTPQTTRLDEGSSPSEKLAHYVIQTRDRMEKRLSEWTSLSSDNSDPIGVQEAIRRVARQMSEFGLRPSKDFTDEPSCWTWETEAGLSGGTLLIVHADVPHDSKIAPPAFRKEPEWLYGEGVGSSRAPLVMVEFALRSLRHLKRLRKTPLGVLCYADEGRDARDSRDVIRKAASVAGDVIVLRPGNIDDHVVKGRRGHRCFRLRVESEPMRPGKASKKPELTRWLFAKLEALSQLSSPRKKLSVSTINIETETLPLHLPHQITATILVTYPSHEIVDQVESAMRNELESKGVKWELRLASDRPPMTENSGRGRLYSAIKEIADAWDIPLNQESSVWPSVAGLVPTEIPCLCGMGPTARDLGTPNESIKRISLVQRTLLLSQYLLREDNG